MKRSILCLAVLVTGLGLSAGTSASSRDTSALARSACRVDDPPPEPIDCPMCAGDAQAHARRLIVIQERLNCVALLATRW